MYIIHLEAAGQQSRVYRNLASCRTVTPWKIGSTDRGASVPSIQRTEYLLRTNVARGLRLLNLFRNIFCKNFYVKKFSDNMVLVYQFNPQTFSLTPLPTSESEVQCMLKFTVGSIAAIFTS